MKICGVIVTYNRKELLLENLCSLSAQSLKLDKIFIVDNHGTDHTYEFLCEKISMEKIEYIYLEDNIGGAGGFSLGLSKAYGEGYDWYMLMDDDGKPADTECIKCVVDVIKTLNIRHEEKNLLNSLVINKLNENELTFGGICRYNTVEEIKKDGKIVQRGLIVGEINPFNGTFVSHGLIKAIGFPNKEFFIKGDEADYLRRAKKAGAFVATVFESRYVHPKVVGQRIRIPFVGEKNIYVEAPWKEYYTVRNMTYSLLQNGDKVEARKRYYKRLICAVLSKCEKKKVIKMMYLGYEHGKKGLLGKLKFDERRNMN